MKDGKHVILYVDDDQDYLDTVRVILESGGYVMVEAHSAEEGLKTYKAVKPEELRTLQIHLCSACDTKVVTQGQGKAAKDTLVHTCKHCGSNEVTCCAMKQRPGPTQGTEGKN